MKIDVLTLFPSVYSALYHGVLGRALEAGIFTVDVHDIREYSLDKHKRCDDAPFGGGAGMVMTAQPLRDAIQAVDPEHKAKRIYMSPRGRTLTADVAQELSKEENLLFLNGSYEGIDQRIIDHWMDEELSIGDYVLTSGDMACMVVINALSRFIDGVLGSSESLDEESFSDCLLEYPQYTRPEVFDGYAVPPVLLTGHHDNIKKWRFEQQLEITKKMRPDLYEKARFIYGLDLPKDKSKKKK